MNCRYPIVDKIWIQLRVESLQWIVWIHEVLEIPGGIAVPRNNFRMGLVLSQDL